MFTSRSTSLCWTRMTTAPGSTSRLTRPSVCPRTAPWASAWPLSRPGTPTPAATGRWAPSEIVQICPVSRDSHSPSAGGDLQSHPLPEQEAESSRLCWALSRSALPSPQSMVQGRRQSCASCQPCLCPGNTRPKAGHGSVPVAS